MVTKPKGLPKTGGRKKGSPNKTSKFINDICDRSGKLRPAEFLLKKMNDPKTDDNVKIDCAKALLPYTDKKMPTSIESENSHSFPSGININLIKPIIADTPIIAATKSLSP